jgi:hypothetical protein
VARATSCSFSTRTEQEAHHLALVPRRAAELGQLLQRPQIALVLGHEVAQDRLGQLAVAHRLLGNGLGLAQQTALDRQVPLQAGTGPQGVHELTLAPRGAADLLERAQDVHVLGIDGQGLGEGVLGPPRVLQLVPPPAGQAHPQIRPRRPGQVLRRLQGALQRVRRLGPGAAVGRGQPLQLLERLVVGGILRHRRLHRALRPRLVPHTFFQDACQLEPGVRPVARPRGAAHAALVELGQVLAQAECAEHLLQRVEGVVEEGVVLE